MRQRAPHLSCIRCLSTQRQIGQFSSLIGRQLLCIGQHLNRILYYVWWYNAHNLFHNLGWSTWAMDIPVSLHSLPRFQTTLVRCLPSEHCYMLHSVLSNFWYKAFREWISGQSLLAAIWNANVKHCTLIHDHCFFATGFVLTLDSLPHPHPHNGLLHRSCCVQIQLIHIYTIAVE